MHPLEETLRERFTVAIGRAFGTENVIDPLIKTGDPRFADYQSNVAMALGKKVGLPPREVAMQIVKHLSLDDLCEPITPKSIAGPGFINLRLRKEFLAAALPAAFAPGRAGVEKTAQPQTIVIDYSGPNVAKQMHVGHLRSTIIGDTLARTLEFLGHSVVRQNHIGDFGTQFGMLIRHLREKDLSDRPFTIADLDRWYKEATERFANDPAFAVTARKTVVELQSGEPSAIALWNRMRVTTHEHYTEVYRILNVTLTDRDERGESFYGPRLPLLVDRIRQALEEGTSGTSSSSRSAPPPRAWEVSTGDLPAADAAEARDAIRSEDDVQRLKESTEPAAAVTKPFAAVSSGALCVFLPGYLDREGRPLPLMVQKSDGGFPYAATDLAALYFRVQENKNTPAEQQPLARDWHAGRVIYFHDSRQTLHFAMVFGAFRAAHWDHLPDGQVASLEFAPFGTILGDDRKPYKTRKGNAVHLLGFLDDAVESAQKVVQEKNSDLPAEKQARVARAVAIAAIKYADLRNDRTTDYVFNPDQMVSPEGNTGPYLQYAFTRVQSIFRKANLAPKDVASAPLLLEQPAELQLAKLLLRFPGVVESVARDLKPHYLCGYLYELATAYSSFYEACPVLKADTEALRLSRLRLCAMVAQTLHLGLSTLLGIETLEEM